MEEKKVNKSGFAIAALVLGIIGIVFSFIPIINNAAFILGILAAIFAIISLVKKASKGRLSLHWCLVFLPLSLHSLCKVLFQVPWMIQARS